MLALFATARMGTFDFVFVMAASGGLLLLLPVAREEMDAAVVYVLFICEVEGLIGAILSGEAVGAAEGSFMPPSFYLVSER